ncbi:MAG: LamG domain-containing protein [Colwellia sp.]|nr:LamG domain-containing protein [Colwellia sp.]MCW9080169.1 LamG domain-containing protein [Colwellia sp.]
MKKIIFALTYAMLLSSTASAALIKSYDFNNDLSDTLNNGVDMIASGGTLSGGFYNFSANQGLRLTDALDDTMDYAIEMRLQIEDSTASWNKLIDFQDLTSDNGLYVLNSEIDFYVSGVNILGGQINTNEFFNIAFVRSAGVITTFLNGIELSPFVDSSDQAVPMDNILNFFEDDFATGQGEAFIGAVDYIRIHGDETTFGDEPDPQDVPEPTALFLMGLGLLGIRLSRQKP